MMIEPSINELDKFVDSRYSLVCAVAKRARELADGAEPMVECSSDKEVTIASHELCASKITITNEAAEKVADEEEDA